MLTITPFRMCLLIGRKILILKDKGRCEVGQRGDFFAMSHRWMPGSFARGKRDSLPRPLVLTIPIQPTAYFYKESQSDKLLSDPITRASKISHERIYFLEFL